MLGARDLSPRKMRESLKPLVVANPIPKLDYNTTADLHTGCAVGSGSDQRRCESG